MSNAVEEWNGIRVGDHVRLRAGAPNIPMVGVPTIAPGPFVVASFKVETPMDPAIPFVMAVITDERGRSHTVQASSVALAR